MFYCVYLYIGDVFPLTFVMKSCIPIVSTGSQVCINIEDPRHRATSLTHVPLQARKPSTLRPNVPNIMRAEVAQQILLPPTLDIKKSNTHA